MCKVRTIYDRYTLTVRYEKTKWRLYGLKFTAHFDNKSILSINQNYTYIQFEEYMNQILRFIVKEVDLRDYKDFKDDFEKFKILSKKILKA